MPEQSTTPSTDQVEAAIIELYRTLNDAPQGTVLMKCHGGAWRILTPWGEAESSSLSRAIELAVHRGLWETK